MGSRHFCSATAASPAAARRGRPARCPLVRSAVSVEKVALPKARVPVKGGVKTEVLEIQTGPYANAGLPRDAQVRVTGRNGVQSDWIALKGPFDPDTTLTALIKLPAELEDPVVVELANPEDANPIGRAVDQFFAVVSSRIPVELQAPFQKLPLARHFTSGEWFVNTLKLGGETFPAYSWIRLNDTHPLFEAKACLPKDTPEVVRPFRNWQLNRAQKDYDFEEYNDLSVPSGTTDTSAPGYRPVPKPYPRRQKTVSFTTNLPLLQKPEELPINERFELSKQWNFNQAQITALLKGLLSDPLHLVGNRPWTSVTAEKESLFQGFGGNKRFDRVKFPSPLVLSLPRPWTDEYEFGRQALAGMHPNQIKACPSPPADFPLTQEDVAERLRPGRSLEAEFKDKRFSIIDYSALEEFFVKVNEQKEAIMYGARCLFYRDQTERILPIAIQLEKNGPIFTHANDASEGKWKWLLAKAFVTSVDSGVHQLNSHFTNCHACSEVIVISLHRQLAEAHPIFRLLVPHYRYTMNINKEARRLLINAGHGLGLTAAGIVERTSSTGQYAMRAAAAVYGLTWEFDTQALPRDLEKRGMLNKDGTKTDYVEDYPYRDDGMAVWKAIEGYVRDYVALYYGSDPTVAKQNIADDNELRAFWEDVQKGHADKTTGWPKLETADNLVQILTTMIWVPSGVHNAVNFSQYDYSGWQPNHPAGMRSRMPEGEVDEKDFMAVMPRPIQSVIVMAIVKSLVGRSPEELYLGEDPEENPHAQEWAVEQAAQVTPGFPPSPSLLALPPSAKAPPYHAGPVLVYSGSWREPCWLADWVAALHKKFESAMLDVQYELEQRNRRRVDAGGVAYPYLLPRKRYNHKGEAIEGLCNSVSI
eukprot:SM000013S26584  [mRNA]  locus=s13:1288077:1299767:+ [translate_table: standard]